MTERIADQAVRSAEFERLFRIVVDVETYDVEKTERDYRDWCAEVFIEDRFDIVCGKLSITGVEMQWVVLNVLHRECQLALEDDADLPLSVDEDHIVTTLSDHGFCPAFQDDVQAVCRDVLKRWKRAEV